MTNGLDQDAGEGGAGVERVVRRIGPILSELIRIAVDHRIVGVTEKCPMTILSKTTWTWKSVQTRTARKTNRDDRGADDAVAEAVEAAGAMNHVNKTLMIAMKFQNQPLTMTTKTTTRHRKSGAAAELAHAATETIVIHRDEGEDGTGEGDVAGAEAPRTAMPGTANPSHVNETFRPGWIQSKFWSTQTSRTTRNPTEAAVADVVVEANVETTRDDPTDNEPNK